MIQSKPLMASTHPAEYLLHKYWARKPHNILGYYIDLYFKKDDLVCDPFCGSGVFLAEAKKRGINTLGFDINPLAALLSDITLNPPVVDEFESKLRDIIYNSEKKWNDTYLLPNKQKVRYLVHSMVTKCDSCEAKVTKQDALKDGTKYLCSKCKNKISFNFEKFHSTRVIQIVTSEGTLLDRDKTNEEIFAQQEVGSSKNTLKGQIYDKDLVLNRRILAFPNMKISDLFTPRAFAIATDLFNQVNDVSDVSLKNALLVFLTSNLAQFSRLIPYRNNLNTGGPAWTVPGFWIAPVHLENNPFIHLEARVKKFVKGLTALHKNYMAVSAQSEIKNEPMQTELNKVKDGTIDGFFFDPPYGDSVPYLEFSAIWNSFLNREINYQREVIVSDRKEFQSGWEEYQKGIEEAVGLMSKKLKTTGKIVVTFNNLDPKAWKILLEAFKKANLKCVEADYQIPAVVSSKAQFTYNTSYTGDFYCVFQPNKSNIHKEGGVDIIIENVMPLFLSRNGKAPKNLVLRYGILTILQENLSLDLFDKLEEIFYGIANTTEEYFLLREEVANRYITELDKYNLEEKIKEICISFLGSGKRNVEDLYKEILTETTTYGSPTLIELKNNLEGVVLFENDYCYLQTDKKHVQTSLF
jgi:hypothetical protein